MHCPRAPLQAGLLSLLLLGCRASDPVSPPPAAPAPPEGQVRIGVVDWYVDYDEGLRAALELERPLWVHFGENPG